MKRFRIWISNFTLIQQFLTIVFLTVALLVLFIFTYLNRNIDIFVNSQMYTYLHRSQEEYIETRTNLDESNAVHFVYNAKTDRFLNSVSPEYENILYYINKNPEGGKIDSYFNYGNNSIVYSIISFDEDYRLISIIKNPPKILKQLYS